MSEWIEHMGDGIPVSTNTPVQVRFLDGSESAPMPAGFWDAGNSNWERNRAVSPIVSYRIHEPSPSKERAA